MAASKYQQRHLRKTIKKINRNDSSAIEFVLNDYDLQSDDTLATLAMALLNNTHVKILYLHNCNISSKGAYLLAFALRSNKSVEHVWLNDNKIGSTGADALASVLCFNRTILTLGLRNNSIGNTGGKSLLRAVTENCNIVGIYLEGNRMSSRIVKEINRITADEPSDDHDDDEVYEHRDARNEDISVTASVISKSFVTKVLGSIKEAAETYHSNELDGSAMSEEVDTSSCYQQKETQHNSKLAKLKQMTIGRLTKKQVRPSPHR